MQFHKVNEIDSFQFFQIPKVLYTSKNYKGLSDGAKMAYGILLDRMKLSKKNKWADDDGNVFIIYPREELAEFMNISVRSITRYMKELREYKLIHEKRQGLCRPNLIYVLKAYSKEEEFDQSEVDNISDSNQTFEASPISNTNISNTENNNNNTDAKEDIEVDEVSNTEFVVDVINSNSKDDVERLFSLAQKVSSSITMSLIKKLLKHYSYKQIQEKLLYMQKFKQRNTIYNPCGFLVQSLRDNYTFVDKAKAILEKASRAIAKSYQELEEYRKIKPASKQVSLSWLKSMKLQLGGVV